MQQHPGRAAERYAGTTVVRPIAAGGWEQYFASAPAASAEFMTNVEDASVAYD